MQHLTAVQLNDGRWRYASLNSRGGGPIGYCFEHREDGHATADEARECYRTYLVDSAMELVGRAPSCADDGITKSDLHRCDAPGCSTLLTAAIGLGGFHSAYLCVQHRTREDIERAIGPVGESWES